jgi:hypothetical protein
MVSDVVIDLDRPVITKIIYASFVVAPLRFVKVDAIALSSIAPADVRRWKTRWIDKAKNNELLRRHYAISVNSTLRRRVRSSENARFSNT